MYYNRDLSWIGFNYRVLLEAKDKSLPLYERIKFLAIYSSNLDEFFRVRYPGIVAMSKLAGKHSGNEQLRPEDVLNEVHNVIQSQQEEYGAILFGEILPELEENNIIFCYAKPFRDEHIIPARGIFFTQILSFIQPIVISSDKMDQIIPRNNDLFLIVVINENATGKKQHVLVNIPSKKLPRFFTLPKIEDKNYIVFLDDIIRENLAFMFPGNTVESVYSLKLNRDAELEVDDSYSPDVLEKIEKFISRRELGEMSRVLFEKGMPTSLQLFLASVFNVSTKNMFEGGRYHNLSDLMKLPSFGDHLKSPKLQPVVYPPAAVSGNIFNLIREKDLLVHLPYHSYAPVLAFFNQAVIDPEVSEIYITLYRVAAESHIVNALISAAKNGKKVTVFVELKARFDEENNIRWSREMKKAGIRLIYSDAKIKVHSKIAQVVTKDKDKTVYNIISTGNFNESTATLYTDQVLFTVDPQIGRELRELFKMMQVKKPDFEALKAKANFKDLYVAQFNLVDEFYRYIDREIRRVGEGKPGLIRIKVNNLEEPNFVNKLYEASKAGVKVQLIVRSICTLIPGVAGLSENIEVHRIVDKYLEHSRIFIFGSDEAKCRVLMGSSDLMTRNLLRRIEVCVKMKDEACRQQLKDYFNLQWSDTSKAYRLNADGTQSPLKDSANMNAQDGIRAYLSSSL